MFFSAMIRIADHGFHSIARVGRALLQHPAVVEDEDVISRHWSKSTISNQWNQTM
jgi:hypothetical protein